MRLATARSIAIVVCSAGALGCGGGAGGDAATSDNPAPAPAPPADPPAEQATPGQPPAQPPPPVPPAGAPTSSPRERIQVSFLRHDGTGAGGEWVTAPEFTQVGPGPGLRVRARANLVDASGDASVMLALWDGDDLVAPSVRHAHEVELTVLRTGTGRLVARDRGGSRQVAVIASQADGVWTVRFVQ